MLSYSFADGAELRLLEHHHAEELFALIDRNRTFLRQWLPEWDVQKSLDDCKALIKSSLEQLAANAGFTLGIWSEGRLAGIIGAGRLDWENRSTNLGYWLGESYQGKGLVTGACRVVIDYLFSELKLKRIEVRCATDNPKSCAFPTARLNQGRRLAPSPGVRRPLHRYRGLRATRRRLEPRDGVKLLRRSPTTRRAACFQFAQGQFMACSC